MKLRADEELDETGDIMPFAMSSTAFYVKQSSSNKTFDRLRNGKIAKSPAPFTDGYTAIETDFDDEPRLTFGELL